MGGGGLPAREKLLQQLLQAQVGAGGLYSTIDGNLGLGINGDLSPELTVPGPQVPVSLCLILIFQP